MSHLQAPDLALVQRLERAEAMANAATVESRRSLQPGIGAEWMEVAGVYAMFDGPASPLTQTYGLGIFDPFLAAEFEIIEQFFAARESPTFHEVCSFARPETLSLLGARGYSPIEASVVLIQPVSRPAAPDPSGITVRIVGADESLLWRDLAAQGWGGQSPEIDAFLQDLGAVIANTRGVTCFIAELDGTPIATAALNVTNAVALMAGASTIPRERRRGAQNALLQARMAFAADRGIDLAMIVTQPGSASQRNSERQGFRPVYTRMKWQLPSGSAVP